LALNLSLVGNYTSAPYGHHWPTQSFDSEAIGELIIPKGIPEIVIFHVHTKSRPYVYEGGQIDFKESRSPKRKLSPSDAIRNDRNTLQKVKIERDDIEEVLNKTVRGETSARVTSVKPMRLWVAGKDKSEEYFLPA
jgi:hypothetical protein